MVWLVILRKHRKASLTGEMRRVCNLLRTRNQMCCVTNRWNPRGQKQNLHTLQESYIVQHDAAFAGAVEYEPDALKLRRIE
jgi:hypothetical protein